MNIAIVADWLPTYAGAEHVVAAFHKAWPDAPIFTTVARKGEIGPLKGANVRVSSLQKWYALVRRHQILLPWMPQAMENIDLKGFDVILSSSHAIGKGIIPPSDAVHICYCHTPMRYAWEMEDEYLDDFHVKGLLRNFARKQLKKIRRWDLATAKRVDVFLANSTETQERIMRIYGRESTVIPPPVDRQFFDIKLQASESSKLEARSYYLAVGRLVPYKRFDLLIDVANEQKRQLKIVGRGQDLARLTQRAGPTIEFLGYVADERLPQLYASAKAVLFPQLEDAGVVPLEAQACGTPVIAYGKGGILDAIVENETGVLFAEQTRDSIKDAISRAEQIQWDGARIRAHASQFSLDRFIDCIEAAVRKACVKFGARG